jgi:pyruvate dehydrogenase E2 component (dihydrolipoyllysine-residue acetyltransferase)
MPEFIRMPAVMANATDAVLSAWLTTPGETIAVGDPIAEIETDKAVVEYAAEIEGTIGRLLVEAGTRVEVGDPIVVVLSAGEDASAIPAHAGGSAGAAAADSHAEPAVATVESAAPDVTARTPVAAAEQQTAAEPAAMEGRQRRLFATPIARRVATQRGIDLTLLTGTGPNGRIVRRDVDAYSGAAAAGLLSSAAARSGAAYRDVPLTGMRRAIAERLTESKSTVPHFYVTAQIRVDRLLTLRQEVNHSSPRKISVNDFVVKAVAAALVEVPAANASWNGDSIRYFDSVDVAVAVAIPNGLLTPVVRAIERLRLTELSGEIARLAESARNGRLQQYELEGGSFAVSNLGMHGVDEFSAIINPPQAGILAVSAAKPQPVVDDDGQLAVGNLMTVTLSADHRVIDGAVAAQWIAALTKRLQEPVSLLL